MAKHIAKTQAPIAIPKMMARRAPGLPLMKRLSTAKARPITTIQKLAKPKAIHTMYSTYDLAEKRTHPKFIRPIDTAIHTVNPNQLLIKLSMRLDREKSPEIARRDTTPAKHDALSA